MIFISAFHSNRILVNGDVQEGGTPTLLHTPLCSQVAHPRTQTSKITSLSPIALYLQCVMQPE